MDKRNQTPQHDMSRTRCLTLTFGDGGVSPIFSSRFEYLVHLPYDIVRCIASSLTLYVRKTSCLVLFPWLISPFFWGKPFPRNRPNKIYNEASLHVHPGRLTWNLQITHLERKVIFQTSMIVVHANLPGCIANLGFPDQFHGLHALPGTQGTETTEGDLKVGDVKRGRFGFEGIS